MATQMLVQRVKGKCTQDVFATLKALDQEVDDERYIKMGKYFRHERDLIIRDIASRK